MAEKTRYSDSELEEFRVIINEKLKQAYADYEQLKNALNNLEGRQTCTTPDEIHPALAGSPCKN